MVLSEPMNGPNAIPESPLFTFSFVLLPKYSSLTLAALVEPLRIANYCDGRNLYGWRYLSPGGTEIPACSGTGIPTEAIAMEDSPGDAIIICGGWNAERYDNPELIRWLRIMGRRGVILGAAETGTYVLARAGLLSGYEATIHWHCQNAFEERFPEIHLKDAMFVIDRKRMTCSGGTACLDMMLEDIDHRHGKALAREVSDQMIYSHVRNADVQQTQVRASERSHLPRVLQRSVERMERNIEKPLTIPELAQRIGISQRKLERLFNKYFSCSAVAFYRVIRLQQARALLTQTDMSVLDVCIACGFASSSYFSKSYTDQFGVRPRDHRTAWPDDEPSPSWPGVVTATTATAKTTGRQK